MSDSLMLKAQMEMVTASAADIAERFPSLDPSVPIDPNILQGNADSLVVSQYGYRGILAARLVLTAVNESVLDRPLDGQFPEFLHGMSEDEQHRVARAQELMGQAKRTRVRTSRLPVLGIARPKIKSIDTGYESLIDLLHPAVDARPKLKGAYEDGYEEEAVRLGIDADPRKGKKLLRGAPKRVRGLVVELKEPSDAADAVDASEGQTVQEDKQGLLTMDGVVLRLSKVGRGPYELPQNEAALLNKERINGRQAPTMELIGQAAALILRDVGKQTSPKFKS